MDVSVIIVTYNTKIFTINCIKSIYEKTFELNFEIILIDNASTDGTIKQVKKQFPQVITLINETNIGFGRANNIGISIAKGKYLFLLNSDTILINNAIKLFHNYMVQSEYHNKKLGAIGCYLFDSNMKFTHSYGELPRLIDLFIFEFKIIINIFKTPSKDCSVEKKVGCIVGAGLFIPKAVFNTVGVFDPIYFMYFEEIDLQLRMKKVGYERLIIPQPQIIHLEGKSLLNPNQKRIFFEQSKFKYLKKHEKKALVLIYKYFYILMRIPRIRFKYSFYENILYFKALFNV